MVFVIRLKKRIHRPHIYHNHRSFSSILKSFRLSDNFLEQDIAMGFFEISIVVLELFMHLKPTGFIKPFAPYIQYMHVQIDSISRWVVPNIILQLYHHLLANSILSIWLKHSKSQNISMQLPLEILQSHGVSPNHNIIVICQSRVFGIFCHNPHVKAGAILNRESFVV